jgi:transketolase
VGQVADVCRGHRAVVVLEEHSVFGGLGGAVCEIAAAEAPTWVCRVGSPDRFSHRCGTYSYLLCEHGIDLSSVVAQVEAFLGRIPARRAA